MNVSCYRVTEEVRLKDTQTKEQISDAKKKLKKLRKK